MTTKDSMASPCNDVCRIDEISGLCQGCQRTLDEIARWSAMADANKRAVLDALPERRRMATLQTGAGEVRA
jgi:predicted Fe-S protein YdhL (DUF1289 family)